VGHPGTSDGSFDGLSVLGTVPASSSYDEVATRWWGKEYRTTNTVEFLDWTIDGTPLRQLLLEEDEPPQETTVLRSDSQGEPAIERSLRDLRDPTSAGSSDTRMPDGRVGLLFCIVCADLDCQTYTADVVVTSDTVEWNDIGAQVAHAPFDPDNQSRPVFSVTFGRPQYETALSRLIEEFGPSQEPGTPRHRATPPSSQSTVSTVADIDMDPSLRAWRDRASRRALLRYHARGWGWLFLGALLAFVGSLFLDDSGDAKEGVPGLVPEIPIFLALAAFAIGGLVLLQSLRMAWALLRYPWRPARSQLDVIDVAGSPNGQPVVLAHDGTPLTLAALVWRWRHFAYTPLIVAGRRRRGGVIATPDRRHMTWAGRSIMTAYVLWRERRRRW
jgi:hypothetical protein